MKIRTSSAIKTALAVVALGFLVYVVEPGRIAAAAASADLRWAAAAFVLLPLNLALENLEWHLLLRRVAPHVGFRRAFESLLCGYALGFFTPARAGELAGRAFYLDYPDKWTLSTLVVFQRLGDMLPAIAIGLPAFCVFVAARGPDPDLLWWSFAGYGAGAVGLVGLLFAAPGTAYRGLHRVVPWPAARARLAFLRDAPRAGLLAVLAVATTRYAVYVTQLVLLLAAFTERVQEAFTSAFFGVGLTYYGKFLIPSITMMDLGVREAMAVFFLRTLDFPAAAAFNASFLLFIVNLLLPAALGIPLVFRMRLKTAPAPRPEADGGTRPPAGR